MMEIGPYGFQGLGRCKFSEPLMIRSVLPCNLRLEWAWLQLLHSCGEVDQFAVGYEQAAEKACSIFNCARRRRYSVHTEVSIIENRSFGFSTLKREVTAWL